MDLDEDLKKLIHQLIHKDTGLISINGSDVTVRVMDQESKLSLSTPVYYGSNYIPKSVRQCVSEKNPPFEDHSIKTYLTVNEESFQIALNYLGNLETLDRSRFKDLLENFTHLAEEWRYFLDENDRRDLIHVRVV